jgi:hypothetical protein
VTAALSAPARALLAWLQERPAAGEGSLKAWGQTRRPSLTLTQVEVRAGELVEADLVTREIKADGRAVYRARERSPEPPPVEVITTLEPSPTPPPASVKRARKAPPAATPEPCATCDQLASALLSWEQQWGPEGSDLMAMEERVQTAERERSEAMDLVAALTRDLADARAEATLSPNAKGALAILSTTRGTSPGEIATRSRILRRSVPHALAELRAAGVAVETTPGLWRRR